MNQINEGNPGLVLRNRQLTLTMRFYLKKGVIYRTFWLICSKKRPFDSANSNSNKNTELETYLVMLIFSISKLFKLLRTVLNRENLPQQLRNNGWVATIIYTNLKPVSFTLTESCISLWKYMKYCFVVRLFVFSAQACVELKGSSQNESGKHLYSAWYLEKLRFLGSD